MREHLVINEEGFLMRKVANIKSYMRQAFLKYEEMSEKFSNNMRKPLVILYITLITSKFIFLFNSVSPCCFLIIFL
jgi:hypothetical protein